MTGTGVAPFFAYAVERELTRLRRKADEVAIAAGEPPQGPPYSHDPVLQRWRFCNVFREDDKTTVWFRENVRDVMRSECRNVTFATFLFRWFNRIETGKVLLDFAYGNLYTPAGWNVEDAREILRGVKPLVTGAYMIKTPTGLTKLEGIIACVEQTLASDVLERASEANTLEECHTILKEAPFLGEFMAYEIVTDLRHTDVLSGATDIDTWASPGPGAARGLDWIYGIGRSPRSYTDPPQRFRMLNEMRDLLGCSRDVALWPWASRPWEMREVEHTLCEFDKHCRGSAGLRLKRKFKL